MPQCIIPECMDPFLNPFVQARWRIYRCQLNTQEESCCCSCNSDAMFEVMKSLYDCYKKKNCDHCNCILCGHLPREERRLGEMRKSVTKVGVGVDTASAKVRKEKAKSAEKILADKTKSAAEKEKALEQLASEGIPLPEGKTVSQKAVVKKVKTKLGVVSKKASSVKAVSSEKLRKAKAAGLLTPIEGKSPEQKEKILRGLVSAGIPLPEGKTASDKKLIHKVRTEMGLPPEPKTSAEKEKYKKAMAAGLVTPLEGKSAVQKEKILKSQAEMGLPLPEGRTPSEKALIAKVKASARPPSEGGRKEETLPEKVRKAKASGLMTPLTGKTPEQREKIVRGLAMQGLPIPEGKTASEKEIIDKVRQELGLPPEPKTSAERDKYQKAQEQGLIVPLDGKSPAQKEKILRGLFDLGVPLPEGRTPSEKSIIGKVKAGLRAPSVAMSEKLRKAKAAGLLTPLTGKTPEQKEKIIRGLAMQGLPLPDAKTPSEAKLMDKVRLDLGLPPEPKTATDKQKYAKAQAQGLIVPLEGKTPSQKEAILKGLIDKGLTLPEGRTPSEKSLIAKVKAGAPSRGTTLSEKMRKAKAAGVVTPLEGKTPEQKEKVLRGMALHGLPLPEGITASETKLIDKVRADLGLPPEGKSASEKEKYKKAMEAGIITPLEGKSAAQKENILRKQAEMGLPLPEGRTLSEKALIDRIRAEVSPAARKKTKSRATMAILGGRPPLPVEEAKALDEKTAKVMKEGKGPVDECICDILTPEKDRKVSSKRTRVPSGKIPSRITSEKLKAAKAAGLLTPLEGKTPEQKEKILRGLAKSGLPLPEAKTASEKKLVDKVRTELGLPPEPKSQAQREKYSKAQAAGFITPLEGKTPTQKEKILKSQAQMGIPLPEGRTPSEKELIKKVKAEIGAPSVVPSVAGMTSEKIRKAKATGLLTPLQGKSPEEKEKVLKARVAAGLPLPEGKTVSDKELIKKVKAATGYISPEGKTPSEKARIHKARRETQRFPTLVGKSPSQKEKILKSLAKEGLPLPEGTTASEKALIDKIRAEIKPSRIPSEKLRAAKAAGLLTPLEGKTPAQKEQILKGLAKAGIPLPEGKTASEKDLIQKVRKEMGLPPEPKTPSMKEKYKSAQAAGIVTPLEGKTPSQKESILKKIKQAGIDLPEGRTPSEKSLIRQVKASVAAVPSEKLRAAKAAGLLTPLEGKTPAQKEKILRGLAKAGIPLPEGKTASEKDLVQKVRKDMALPPEPKTPSMKEKYKSAQAAGIITPLEGKSPSQKEAALKKMREAGIELPEGRTASEKSLIRHVKVAVPSEKLRASKAAGILTPLEGKTPAQKEAILKKMKEAGLQLPEGKTASEKSMIRKIKSAPPSARPSRRVSLGPPALPPEERRKLDEKTAKNVKEGKGPVDECICGLLTPQSERILEKGRPSRKTRGVVGRLSALAGKSPAEKEKTLRNMAMQGIGLPEGETASEKKLIDKVRTEMGLPPEPKSTSDKKKYDKALSEGLIVPLEGKSDSEKERILKSQAEAGLPLPVGRSPSEKALIAKVKAETKARLSVPSAVTKIPSEKLRKAKAAGLLTPLEGKSSAQKEKILRGLAEAGLPLPDGKTPSEKSLVNKIKTEYGVPPVPKTASEKEIVKKAKADGLFTPLTGKSSTEKEKILKGLAEAGLPMPEGKTASEKSLVKKIRTAAGLPPEPTPSERRRSIKTKSKKVGVGAGKVSAKGVGSRARYPPPPGITEELEEITKTTTCDRGCGCDKKKIRFKHSYVKIKVTSPDISSLCPCPNECIPGVKGGIFTDNEGIKVTVGRAVGLPYFFMEPSTKIPLNTIEYSGNNLTLTNNTHNKDSYIELPARFDSDLLSCKLIQEYKNVTYNSGSAESTSRYCCQKDNATYCNTEKPKLDKSKSNCYTSVSDKWFCTTDNAFVDISVKSSFDSIIIIKTESSLSFSTSSYVENSLGTVSIISLVDSSFSSHSSPYLCYSKTEDSFSDSESAEEIEYFTKEIDYSMVGSIDRNTQETSIMPFSERIKKYEFASPKDVIIFRMSESNIRKDNKYMSKYKEHQEDEEIIQNYKDYEPIFVINDLNSDHHIMAMVDQIISQKLVEDTSSIFVVVPTSDECDTDTSYKTFSSTICINMSKIFTKFSNNDENNDNTKLATRTLHSKNTQTKQKETCSKILFTVYSGDITRNACVRSRTKCRNIYCQANLKVKSHSVSVRGVSMDTTQDRPCCCTPNMPCTTNYSLDHCVASAVSEFMSPIITDQSVAQALDAEKLPMNDIYPNSPLAIPSNPTLIRICRVPPCSGYKTCHDVKNPAQRPPDPCGLLKEKQIEDPSYRPNINQPCTCSPEKLMGLLMSAKDRKTVGVGGPDTTSAESKTSGKKKENTKCNKCGLPLAKQGTKGGRSTSCQCQLNADVETGTVSKKLKKSKRNKNKVEPCQCKKEEPVTSTDDEDPYILIDEKQMRKMQSDMTHMTSGFRMNKKKRPPKSPPPEPEPLMTLEEALMYLEAYASLSESTDENSDSGVDGKKKKKKKKGKESQCECPQQSEPIPEPEPEPELEPEEPLKGFKFTIGAKGSGSKGLSGVCCFDLIQTSNYLVTPPSSSETTMW
ncbi:hypothetical protein K1T71_000402 [Dendrolimus kikuchii]|uniref:Uncharacterized protein n=1 Tax=Dendrolimus kikuchii TaxID=765133 RepID=A0ACC1DJ17_9NEOP|nr:hypothetical protein K1T71_000402 [Dendrolimus kikuchii]